MVTLPTDDFRRTTVARLKELPGGLDAQVHRAMGWWRRSVGLRSGLRREAEQIAQELAALKTVADENLNARLAELRRVFRRRPEAEPVNEQAALAVVAEIAARQLGLRAHTVQLLGALALLRGCLAEMATGEGKTLTVALAAAVAGWSGRPCHVLTANDYLASRDAEWLRPFYEACGGTVGCVTGEMAPDQRRLQYAATVTYTTSKELLADFLRDRLRLGRLQDGARRHLRYLLTPDRLEQLGLVLRGLDTAFIDEADNLLIDEAVTPLIISRSVENEPLRAASHAAHRAAAEFTRGVHYETDLTLHSVWLSPAGRAKLRDQDDELAAAFAAPSWRAELVRQALLAREFFHRDRQYVIDDGKIQIVDESTGRLMPQRSWQQGLHQAIEAKEGLEMSDPAETIARMSFQRFFRLFRRLSGLTGTAEEAAGEFWFVYRLPTAQVPTNRPILRREAPDRFFLTAEAKWDAIADEVVAVQRTGRPVLVGTRTVAASERLAGLLALRGVACEVINAVRHLDEARIVAAAGQTGRVTVATNMAGRGTDIKLTAEARAAGGLHVIATERHSSRRIDRQLFGRAGRQGDPGSAQAFVSLDDDLLMRFLPTAFRRVLSGLLESRAPGVQWAAQKAVERAQARAQRLAARQRQGVMHLDSWADDALSFAAEG